MEYQILKKLCWYDVRNPNRVEDERKANCSCDNCFYGRHELAETILLQLEVLKKTYLRLQVLSNKNMVVAGYTDSIRAELRTTISEVTGKSGREVQEECEIEALQCVKHHKV